MDRGALTTLLLLEERGHSGSRLVNNLLLASSERVALSNNRGKGYHSKAREGG